MKYLGMAALCVVLIACQGKSQERTQLKSQKDSVSYSIGLNIGNSFRQQSMEVDPDILAQGIKDILSGGKPMLTEEEAKATLNALQNRMMAKQEETMKATGEKNKKDGEAYLAENKKKDSVVTLPSGLQYKVLKMGSGK